MTEQSTQEKIALFVSVCEKLLADLAAAEARATSLREDYAAKALDRLAAGNTKAATAARREIADAREEVDDIKTALAQTQANLRQAEGELTAEIAEARWRETEAVGEQYVAAMAELQDAVETLVAKFVAVQPLADRMVREAPVRVHMDVGEHQRLHNLRLQISRIGGDAMGKLGTPGMDPQFLSRQPTLKQRAEADVAGLLSHRKPTTGAMTGDAA